MVLGLHSDMPKPTKTTSSILLLGSRSRAVILVAFREVLAKSDLVILPRAMDPSSSSAKITLTGGPT
ncbi:hypothetical protein RSOL_281400 [Rhizoctonia solani AG-3 Rhs1AP]|uniref:Uncharacterized protein n=1 Tax=Rhizoctonia solani AG-3 Rhs1AP TaxID=1086054 RepID=A0A0A1UKS9_9AGAM|nr:hypothetical protein RSOL_281400 [Rhizoctonia solani AG-3 Rhs1AP]